MHAKVKKEFGACGFFAVKADVGWTVKDAATHFPWSHVIFSHWDNDGIEKSILSMLKWWLSVVCVFLIALLVLHSGEDFHPTSNSLIHGTHVPTKDGIDRMVEDVEKQ